MTKVGKNKKHAHTATTLGTKRRYRPSSTFSPKAEAEKSEKRRLRRNMTERNRQNDTSPSLVPHSQSMDPASSTAESSQSIIPPSEEPKHKKDDMVQVRTQTREDGRIYRAVGRVRCADPDRPHYVRLYGYKNYRRVLQNFTRQWTLMISNDTQSSAEDSISQSY